MDIKGWYDFLLWILPFYRDNLISNTNKGFENGKDAALWRLCDASNVKICLNWTIYPLDTVKYLHLIGSELFGFYGTVAITYLIYKLFPAI